MEEEPTILEETIVPKGGSNTATQHASVPGPSTGPSTAIPAPMTMPPIVHPPIVGTPTSNSPLGSTAIPRADIAQALAGVRLPERKDFRGAADSKSPIPTEKHEMPLVTAMPHEPSADLSDGTRTPQSPNTEQDSVVVPVHTLKQDLEGIVVDQKMSMVHAVAMEQDKKRGQADIVAEASAHSQRSRRTSLFVFASFVLVVLGGAALFGVMTIMGQRAPSAQTSTGSALLFAEQAVAFPLGNYTPTAIKQTLSQARYSSSGAVGSIVHIVPMVSGTDPTTGATIEQEATLKEFLQAMGTHAPEDLVRALSSEFFFGIHAADQNAPVFIIPVVSYDRAFSAMLTWEKTLNADLTPVYTQVPVLAMGPDNLPTQRTFQDEVMRNYDTRTLKDDSGKIRLYYSFPSRSILVIAENPYSFAEVLSRLQAQRRL